MKLDWYKVVLYIIIAGIECCWLYALMALLNKPAADERLSILGILALYPLSFGFNGLLRRLRWPGFFLRIISWIVWALAMLLMVKFQLWGGLAWSDTSWLLAVPRAIAGLFYGFRPELLVLIATGVIWWLGRRLAYAKVNFTTLVSEFQFGLVILVVTFLIASSIEVDIAHPAYLIAAFFLFSLGGMSIAHAREGVSWLSGLNQGHWVGLLLVSISLVLILGFLVSLAVTPDLLQLCLAAIKWVWGLIVKAMAFLASLLPSSGPAEPLTPVPGVETVPSEEFELWTMPEAVRTGLGIGWMVLFGGLIVLAIWRISSDIFRWLRRRLASMAGAEYEPLPGAFRADLLSLLKRIGSNLLSLILRFRRGAGREPGFAGVASVRQVYRWLLRWASTGGCPRGMSQTPYEYCSALAGLLPEAQGDLELITQGYVRARYGASLPDEGESARLSQAWHRVRQNRLKRIKRKNNQE
jgi:hypothetical protein